MGGPEELRDHSADDGAARRLIIELPAEALATRERLLAALAERLRFPAFFGANWDALEECLCDLSWLEPWAEIQLVHAVAPLVAESAQSTIYRSILESVASYWAVQSPARWFGWNWPTTEAASPRG